jgi:DNA-binding NarL/FixJ family response regulator
VLVVDDASAFASRMIRLLTELPGVRARACLANAGDALECLRVEPVECLIIDVPVKDSTGFELLSALRKACPRAVLLVVTNQTDWELQRRGEQLGIDGYFEKATDFERVLEIVRGLTRAPGRATSRSAVAAEQHSPWKGNQ